jgi:hypothetical protein
MTDAEGRAGQEAARLLAAAQEWLRTSAPHLAPVGEDGETCPCPLCRAVVEVREADPDSVGRWVDAAVAGLSATLARAGTLASQPAGTDDGTDARPDAGTASAEQGTDDEPVGHDGPGVRVRRIRLDDGGAGPDVP